LSAVVPTGALYWIEVVPGVQLTLVVAEEIVKLVAPELDPVIPEEEPYVAEIVCVTPALSPDTGTVAVADELDNCVSV
jgi:hypothetical protein